MSNHAAVSTVSPSTLGPSGVMWIATDAVSLATGDLSTAIGRNRDGRPGARVHRWSVVRDTPNDAAIVRTPSSRRRCRQYSTACCWSTRE
jgi:hypothetical protein